MDKVTMTTLLVILCTAVGLCLVLLVRLHARLDAIPARVWNIAKQERDKDEGRAAAALAEATAAKLVSITAALRVYDEELAAGARRQVADAETLARVAERRLTELSPMMETAAQLVRELRAALDALRAAPSGTASASAEGSPPEPDPDTRATIEMPPPVMRAPPPTGGEDEEPEELTTVATRAVGVDAAAPATTPMPGRAVASRARVSPRAPAVAPPGSAETPPPEPAQRAAGLTRPAGSTRPPAALASPSAGAAPRRATILGIPPPSGVQRSAPTLVSMTAVTPPRARGKASIRMEGEDDHPGGGSAA
jgi:hypothetical protein